MAAHRVVDLRGLRPGSIGALVLAAVLGAASLVAIPTPSAAGTPGEVVITEIMYDPPSDLDSDEFIELHNPGVVAVDVSGWCMDGVSFCFPAGSEIAAGDYVVISPDPAATLATYGVSAVGTYGGKLKNGGEEVSISDEGGSIIHSFVYDDVHPWPTTPDGQGPSLELISLDADLGDPWNWAASTSPAGHTAGAANSVAAAGVPPRIPSVVRSVDIPAAGQDIVVTAEVQGSTTDPTLTWRFDLGTETTVTMTPTGGDFWEATIPGSPAGTLIEYRVGTTGVFDHSSPRSDDTATTVGVFVPREVDSQIPVFEWFIREGDYQSMVTDHLLDDTGFESVLVVGDEVITGARVRVRGSSSRNDPKVNFKWELPQGHDLVLEGLVVEPVDEFAIQAEYSDRSYGRSLLSWRSYRDAGLPVAQTFKVRVERNGSFQGLYSYVDTYDKTWRKREGFQKDGSLYKASSGAFSVNRDVDKRWKRKSGPDDGFYVLGLMIDFIQDPDPAIREAYVREFYDIPEIINYAAVTAILEHIDSSSKNFYAFDSDVTGRWSLIPWDLDHTLGNRCSCNVFSDFVTPAEAGDKANEMIAAVLEVEEFREMYFRRLRTLVDELLAPGRLEGIFDSEVGPADPEAALDKALWGQCCTVPQERGFLFDDIEARRAVFEADPRVPPSQAPAPNVVITEIMADPADPDSEYIELYNPDDSAVDVSGWSISDGVDITIQNGTVIPAGGTVLLVADGPAFSGAFGRTLFVADSFSGGLKAGGEALTLLRSDGSIADTVDYSAPGFPTIGADEAIEVLDATQDNSVGSNWTVVPGGTPNAHAGVGGDPIDPVDLPEPPPPPTPYACVATDDGTDVTLTFTGDRGSSENLRIAGGSWVAEVSALDSYTVAGGSGTEFEVRARGEGFDTPYSTVPCSSDGPPPPPPPDSFVCTASTVGGDLVLDFSGLRGSSENLRRTGGAWVASVTGLDSFTIVGGAGTAYEVRVRGAGFDTPYTTVGCT